MEMKSEMMSSTPLLLTIFLEIMLKFLVTVSIHITDIICYSKALPCHLERILRIGFITPRLVHFSFISPLRRNCMLDPLE